MVNYIVNNYQKPADRYYMILEYHPSYESIEAHLNAASRRFSRDALTSETLAPTIEDHLLVCGVCQEAAEGELRLASLIRRSLVTNNSLLCRRQGIARSVDRSGKQKHSNKPGCSR